MVNDSLGRPDEQGFRIQRAKRVKVIRRLLWVGIPILIAAVLGWGLFFLSRRSGGTEIGAFYPPVGAEHIGSADPPPTPYNSNPPSSGAHFGSQANWGVYDYEVNDQIFIHNLEHGGIWFAYRPSVPVAAVEELQAIVAEIGGSKIVMAPRSANDADIAIVSWSRVLKFNLEGEHLAPNQREGIRAFYESYKNRGPEFVPDFMPGIDPKTVQ